MNKAPLIIAGVAVLAVGAYMVYQQKMKAAGEAPAVEAPAPAPAPAPEAAPAPAPAPAPTAAAPAPGAVVPAGEVSPSAPVVPLATSATTK